MIYPTFRRIDSNNIISEEQMDDVPDFYIARDKPSKEWWVKWRTSTCWTRGFKTAREAMRAIESECQTIMKK